MGETERPAPKFAVGQVVAIKSTKGEPIFRVQEVFWSHPCWFYRWNRRNAASENMLRALSEQEKGDADGHAETEAAITSLRGRLASVEQERDEYKRDLGMKFFALRAISQLTPLQGEVDDVDDIVKAVARLASLVNYMLLQTARKMTDPDHDAAIPVEEKTNG